MKEADLKKLVQAHVSLSYQFGALLELLIGSGVVNEEEYQEKFKEIESRYIEK